MDELIFQLSLHGFPLKSLDNDSSRAENGRADIVKQAKQKGGVPPAVLAAGNSIKQVTAFLKSRGAGMTSVVTITLSHDFTTKEGVLDEKRYGLGA